MEIIVDAAPAFLAIIVFLAFLYKLLDNDSDCEIDDFFDSIEKDDEKRH